MKNFEKALKEYHDIVTGIKQEYTREQRTIKTIRKDHPELNFMDDDEIEDIIKHANNM